MLAGNVEGRGWSTTIAEHALDDFAQIAASMDPQYVVRDVLADIREDERNAVDDRKLAQTIWIPADDHTLDDVPILFTRDMGNPQRRSGIAGRTTGRADRPERFEMANSHFASAADDDGRTAGRNDLAGG